MDSFLSRHSSCCLFAFSGAEAKEEKEKEDKRKDTDKRKLAIGPDANKHVTDLGGHTPTTAPSVSPRSGYSTEGRTRRSPASYDEPEEEEEKGRATPVSQQEGGVSRFQGTSSCHVDKPQGLLNRSVWTCIGAAIRAQQEVANVALTVVMAEQGFDLLGCLEIAKQVRPLGKEQGSTSRRIRVAQGEAEECGR